ncbi:MAG: sugar transferase [Pseudanabaenaceae cyanobacterium bins.39]|nr:sugar transferase [Pseudanabaenaceae cyanobacterium bins.39]
MVTRSKINSQVSLRPDKVFSTRNDHYAAWGKRLFDIIFAALILIGLSPVYLAIAILIAVSSGGSVLYIHPRVGLHGKEFNCIKFRTMIEGADKYLEEYLNSCPISRAEYEESFKLKYDPRITAIGKFLRVTSLDELPQFWNVLTGDMSVVGPRPLVQAELVKYGKMIDRVLSVRPGIAGLWQVSGRNDLPYARRVQLDASYVRRMSLSLDIWLIIRTILVVIYPKGKGAY